MVSGNCETAMKFRLFDSISEEIYFLLLEFPFSLFQKKKIMWKYLEMGNVLIAHTSNSVFPLPDLCLQPWKCMFFGFLPPSPFFLPVWCHVYDYYSVRKTIESFTQFKFYKIFCCSGRAINLNFRLAKREIFQQKCSPLMSRLNQMWSDVCVRGENPMNGKMEKQEERRKKKEIFFYVHSISRSEFKCAHL